MRTFPSSFAFLAAALALACSSSSEEGDSSGKISGAGGSAGVAGATSGGGSAGSSGSAGSPGAGASGGSGGVSCDQLELDYSAALGSAKECSLSATTSVCDVLVRTKLGCGEFGFADAANAAALSDLAEIEEKWDGARCGQSCGLGGHSAVSASCEGSGPIGHCQDKLF
jgi:hypothetical protein